MQNNSSITPDVAILAPVPLEHITSGIDTIAKVGKVAFGSRAFEVFRKLREIAGRNHVDVFIYASNHSAVAVPIVFWRARCINFVETDTGQHPDGMKYRPETTLKYQNDNKGYWALFWEVDQLRPAPFSISKLRPFGKKQLYSIFFVPKGPILIEPSLEEENFSPGKATRLTCL